MGIEKFEDIVAWQIARQLANQIHNDLKGCRDWSFIDQIQRACLSIMNNIAEGFDRKGDKEFIRFLVIAKGSCAEVRSMLYLADDYGYIVKDKTETYHAMSIRINNLLAGFITSLRKRICSPR